MSLCTILAIVNFALQQQTVEALQVLNLAKSQGASRVVVSERLGLENFRYLCISDASECTHTRRCVKYSHVFSKCAKYVLKCILEFSIILLIQRGGLNSSETVSSPIWEPASPDRFQCCQHGGQKCQQRWRDLGPFDAWVFEARFQEIS